MQKISESCISEIKIIDFGIVAVDSLVEKYVYIENIADKPLTYRTSLTYVLNSIDHVFDLTITNALVNPRDSVEIKVTFKPNIVGQSFTEYYVIDDTGGNTYRLTVTGCCYGPLVHLNKQKVKFTVVKNVNEQRKKEIVLINTSPVDTTYQWLMPTTGQGSFQISTGNCGLIRAFESITTSIVFSGISLGVYTAELVCLVLNQEPLFLNAFGVVMLVNNPVSYADYKLDKGWKRKNRSVHLMENSLNRLSYKPCASVFEKYLDFEKGSVKDVTRNISQTLSVTNHEPVDGYLQWIPDPDNVFLIDPISCIIPSTESRLFTVRFRPKSVDEVYGFIMCAEFRSTKIVDDKAKLQQCSFRIPCIGHTWRHCTLLATEVDCPIEVVLPPTVPTRTTFSNFMLANKLEVPMYYKLVAPKTSNFVVLPMCGIVPSRGWQIITVALEPKTAQNFCENWDLIINGVQKARINFAGSAENSQLEILSPGYNNTSSQELYEFPPTITGCTNYITVYLHNVTRMEIHMRVLNSVSWLGADNCGTIVVPPKEIVRYHWWFFPKVPDQVYDTTITCTCVCLIDGKPVGEPTEIFLHIFGFSELPDLKIVPRYNNLHDIPVGETSNVTLSLFNYGSCYFTSRLYHEQYGMGDDWSGDKIEIDSYVNSLKPSSFCEVTLSVTPDSAGSREIDIRYTVLFRTEFDEIEEIQPITKIICVIWYDGIYPTFKIKRTISVSCPVILSNHCVWNLTNVDELNKALEDSRPNLPLDVTIYAPELCLKAGPTEFIFVLGCVYAAPVPWSLKRDKICDCKMVKVQIGISFFEMRHTCVHRPLVELSPVHGYVSKDRPELLHLKFNYDIEGLNSLCYMLSLPNNRTIYININITAHLNTRGILLPLRRIKEDLDCLAVLDCGRVPINNLDAVIRLAWLYNPTDVFTTWRLLRGNVITPVSIIRCLLFFAEVPPLAKLPIPFAFMPREMVDYEMEFLCSFGYETIKIIVRGQGGLPNSVETRLDVPYFVESIIRNAYRKGVVYLSKEHITIPIMPTHSLSRDVISINNDTDNIMRFIWLPERIPNIVNIVMTPCWGVIQPKTSQWITMTVYALQEPATFTTTLSCEILDLTERRRYQRNELLRRQKTEQCKQEFTITEKGIFHAGINDYPPYVLNIPKPQPKYISVTVSVSSKGQRDGYPRMLMRQQWEQTPPYDLMSDFEEYATGGMGTNNMNMPDVIRIIDGIIWDALNSKMFKHLIEFYAKEEIPTYEQLVKKMQKVVKARLSRRVSSGICDAIVNKAVFHMFGLNPKHELTMLEAL